MMYACTMYVVCCDLLCLIGHCYVQFQLLVPYLPTRPISHSPPRPSSPCPWSLSLVPSSRCNRQLPQRNSPVVAGNLAVGENGEVILYQVGFQFPANIYSEKCLRITQPFVIPVSVPILSQPVRKLRQWYCETLQQ